MPDSIFDFDGSSSKQAGIWSSLSPLVKMNAKDTQDVPDEPSILEVDIKSQGKLSSQNKRTTEQQDLLSINTSIVKSKHMMTAEQLKLSVKQLLLRVDNMVNMLESHKYASSFVHFIDKDRLSVHKMGQIYHRCFTRDDEPLVLIDKNKFQFFKVLGDKKFIRLKLSLPDSS